MSQDDTSFYTLDAADLDAHTLAAPRRVPRRGKADIGGRVRVARILQSAGLPKQGSPQRINGATNEVWRSGDYVVRVGFIPGGSRLRREAELAQYLPAAAMYPSVVGSGLETFGEFIIVRHRPGMVLSEAWNHLDGPARKSAVQDLATAMKAVHGVKFTTEQAEALVFPVGEGGLALPHQLPAKRIIDQLEQARQLPYVDSGLIDAAIERTEEVADSIFEHERYGLVHGDLHFENVLVEHGVIVALVDFEWCRPAPREVDIDVLARFCANPQLHIGGDYQADPHEYRNVLRWFAEQYPEPFAVDNFVDRMMLVALSFEVPWLLKMPPEAPMLRLNEWHPLRQLAELLDKGTHVERLGWQAQGDDYSYYFGE